MRYKLQMFRPAGLLGELLGTHPRWAALSELSDLALTVLIDVNKDSAEWNGLRLSIAAGGDASAKR